jgi:hypothetical protein
LNAYLRQDRAGLRVEQPQRGQREDYHGDQAAADECGGDRRAHLPGSHSRRGDHDHERQLRG